MESLGGKLGDNFSISGRPFVNMLSAVSVCLLNEHNIYVNGADRRGALRKGDTFLYHSGRNLSFQSSIIQDHQNGHSANT